MLSQLAGVSILVISVAASPLSTSHFVVDRSGSNQHLAIAPLHQSNVPENHVQDSYIVVLKSDVDLTTHTNVVASTHAEDPLAGEDSGLTHVYDGQIKGYAGRFANSTIAKLRTMAEVDYIEHDQLVWASDIEKGAPWVSPCQMAAPFRRSALKFFFADASLDSLRVSHESRTGTGSALVLSAR